MPTVKISCFVDSNVLVYAADPAEPAKWQLATDLLRSLANSGTLVLSPQSLNESYVALTRKRRLPAEPVRSYLTNFVPFCTAPYDFPVTARAWLLQDKYGYPWWDCMLLASAAIAGCNIFFSEDMQHRHQLEEMTIINPFQ